MTERKKRYHTLVLESAQLDAVRDGLDLLKRQLEWARQYVPSNDRARMIEPFDTAANEALWAVKEHMYAHGSVPAACERAGCGWLAVLAFDSKRMDADYDMAPDELLIKRVAELLDKIEQVESSAKYLTNELARDPAGIVEIQTAPPDDPGSARVHMRRAGDRPSSRPTSIRVVDWMTFNSLESQTYGVRNALRMLRKSQQKAPNA